MIKICIQGIFPLSRCNANYQVNPIFHCTLCAKFVVAWTETLDSMKEMEPKASYIVRCIKLRAFNLMSVKLFSVVRNCE